MALFSSKSKEKGLIDQDYVKTEWVTPEFGKSYKDVVTGKHGVVLAKTYHITGCLSVDLYGKDIDGDPAKYSVLVTRLQGFVGDPTQRTPKADSILGAEFEDRITGVKGNAISFTESMYEVDKVNILWLKKDGDFTTAWFDQPMLRRVGTEQIKLELPKPEKNTRKKTGSFDRYRSDIRQL